MATRCASPSEQSLTSQICCRAGSTARSVPPQVASTPLDDVQSGARTGHLPTNAQPPPARTVVHFAVRCNSSLRGITTEFARKQRRSETRTDAGETGAAERPGGKRSGPRRWKLPPRSFFCVSGTEFRQHTGTCPIRTECEEDHQFHCHPFAEDHNLPNGVCVCAPLTLCASAPTRKRWGGGGGKLRVSGLDGWRNGEIVVRVKTNKWKRLKLHFLRT